MSGLTMLYVVAAAIAVLFWRRSYVWSRDCWRYWQWRRYQGRHERAPWRRDLYNDMIYRGASRSEAYRYSTQCEWLTGWYAAVNLALGGAALYGLAALHAFVDRG